MYKPLFFSLSSLFIVCHSVTVDEAAALGPAAKFSNHFC